MCQAQDSCFTFEDEEKTIINGLTNAGKVAEELTIPATVRTVRSDAFQDALRVNSLIIDGGDPEFTGSLFGSNNSSITDIDMGSGMTVSNMRSLLISLREGDALETVEIGGYTGGEINWPDVSVLTSSVKVVLPAGLVGKQVFGDAQVYGRFTVNKEIVSFCGNASFQDVDKGSNMLFYVADESGDNYIHIQRVYYIVAGKGVLIHKTESSSGYADLPRIDDFDEEESSQAETDRDLYAKNMLVGVTEATTIGATDGDKTNLVLSNGAFHPTSGGVIGANKAYLQVSTGQYARGILAISFPDDEAADIKETEGGKWKEEESAYDLQGRRVSRTDMKGIYIINGRKFIKQ